MALIGWAAGCSAPSPCDRFAELTRRCDQHERPATAASICRNAFDRVGEADDGSRDSARQARYVRWLNATLRLQAECMAGGTTCDDYTRCREREAARP